MSLEMQRMPLSGESKPIYRRPLFRACLIAFATLIAVSLVLYSASDLLLPNSSDTATSQRFQNVYHHPGVLDVWNSSPARFRPLDETRSPVDYLKLLNSADGVDIPELDAIRNKFVLLYGDSLERKALQALCGEIGIERSCIDVDNGFQSKDKCEAYVKDADPP